MLVICTTLKSVVFPMTVVMCTEPDRDAQYLHCSNFNLLKICYFNNLAVNIDNLR